MWRCPWCEGTGESANELRAHRRTCGSNPFTNAPKPPTFDRVGSAPGRLDRWLNRAMVITAIACGISLGVTLIGSTRETTMETAKVLRVGDRMQMSVQMVEILKQEEQDRSTVVTVEVVDIQPHEDGYKVLQLRRAAGR
jgi:hypothetical protein